MASSGPHSNGYSLIRKVIEVSQANLGDAFEETTLGRALLEPTRIYVKPVLALLETIRPHALAHITGGGLPGNIARVIPDGLTAMVESTTWNMPPVFEWIQDNGNIALDEMYRTFNCGMGMLLVLDANDAPAAVKLLEEQGEKAWLAGRVEKTDSEDRVRIV